MRDSSLSAAIQAIVAAEVGQLELAYDYWGETAFIDLRDLAFNTRDGVHLAALAGAWLVAVAGFGGMRDHGDRLRFAPRLPPRLSRLAFRLVFRGRRLRVAIEPDVGHLRAARRRAARAPPPRGGAHRFARTAPETRPLPQLRASRTPGRPPPAARRRRATTRPRPSGGRAQHEPDGQAVRDVVGPLPALGKGANRPGSAAR